MENKIELENIYVFKHPNNKKVTPEKNHAKKYFDKLFSLKFINVEVW